MLFFIWFLQFACVLMLAVPPGLSKRWVTACLRWLRPELGSILPWRRKCCLSISRSCWRIRSCSGLSLWTGICQQMDANTFFSWHVFALLPSPNRQLYKPHAFLLCEEEREQFLFHLLSLNTVDYLCFTRVFTSVCKSYKLPQCQFFWRTKTESLPLLVFNDTQLALLTLLFSEVINPEVSIQNA